jgi:hypothetical protein
MEDAKQVAPNDRKRSSAKRSSPRFEESFWIKLAFELFVVFTGVTAAFALEAYRADQERREVRSAVYDALDNELNQFANTVGPTLNREATRQLAQWDEAVARGEHPVPPTFRMPIERPPTGVWEAATRSQAIDLIDPKLFFELARFYNREATLGDQFQRYSSEAEKYVWPLAAQGPTAFWDSGGSLKPAIAAHILRLRNWRDQQARNNAEARSLRLRLREAEKRS